MPTNSLYIDENYLNVRRIDEKNCVGCKSCISACPFKPSMIIWNSEKQKTIKCDLCRETPFWSELEKPVCVEVCPTRALKFSNQPPKKLGNEGYITNLRGEGWKRLGLAVDRGEKK